LPSEDPLRILIAGGGTGGHVIPALAIARELRDSSGAIVRFVGTARGIETKLVPEAGFELELIHVGMLKNVSLMTCAHTLTDLPRGILRCMSLLRSFRPHVVVGVGGYASGPAMMAAVLLRFPTLAYEPNAAPGLANRIVGKLVSAAAINFEESRRFFRNAKVTGVPIRREFFSLPPRLLGALPHLLVFGGSQGARALNQVMPKILVSLLEAVPALTALHQAGSRHAESTLEAYRNTGANPSRWQVSAFLDDMPQQFAEADLILCRSGSSVAEIAAAGKPSLLVPFPQSADDHQKKNAEVFARAGAAEMLLEDEMTPELLLGRLVALLRDKSHLAQMSEQAKRLSRPDALHAIAQMALELAGRKS
jgi:UDP-N-acetylglucosamine--N-acetylmuramyl-(pentapeptide) pyrophosphoryl-undecaprenol N-acetylglucosamine transferase